MEERDTRHLLARAQAMKDIWNILEERTRTWGALGRQGLADAIWGDYVPLRFWRTGDPRALEYLYPYLNHAYKPTRLHAIQVAALVFEGRGPRAVESLDYFFKHPDPFLRDRAVQVIAAAVTGSADDVILETLGPYLNQRNQFIRKQALVGLGSAAIGQGSEKVLAEIQRVAQRPGPRPDETDLAIARAFAGRPTPQVYEMVAKPSLASRVDQGNDYAVATLVRETPPEWYQRACREIFEPMLHAPRTDELYGFAQQFIQRAGIEALSFASPGRGMEAFGRMLHLRASRCTSYAMFKAAPECFRRADVQANRGPLLDLLRTGDIAAQRLAAVCLGSLVEGQEDTEGIGVLRDLCSARSKAVQAGALLGLGLAAKSSCDDSLRDLCLGRVSDEETAPWAIRGLGLVYLGSGRDDVLADLRRLVETYRNQPVRGRRYNVPLAACYQAIGAVYLGTGSTAPLEVLLEVLSRPARQPYDEYHWVASLALVMIEFAETALRRYYQVKRRPWYGYALPWGW
jgi:hypothetical protein